LLMNADKILKKIINNNVGAEAAISMKWKSIPLSAKHFSPIEGKVEGNVCAVDGGSAVVADGGAWIISKLRVGVVEYNPERKVKEYSQDFFAIIVNKGVYEVSVFDKEYNELIVDLPDFNQLEIDEVPAKIMKILEWRACLNLCNERDNCFILMDSSLEGDNSVEENIIEKVWKTSNVVVGFCKTSRMMTNNGRSLLGFVNSMAGKNSAWYYYPLFEDEVFVKTFIAKLSTYSKYCHKVQLFGKEENISRVFGLLAFFAGDSQVPGYHYPLVKADKVARINHFEKRDENNKWLRLLKKTDLFHDVQSQNFHSELDKGMYRQ